MSGVGGHSRRNEAEGRIFGRRWEERGEGIFPDDANEVEARALAKVGARSIVGRKKVGEGCDAKVWKVLWNKGLSGGEMKHKWGVLAKNQGSNEQKRRPDH